MSGELRRRVRRLETRRPDGVVALAFEAPEGTMVHIVGSETRMPEAEFWRRYGDRCLLIRRYYGGVEYEHI